MEDLCFAVFAVPELFGSHGLCPTCSDVYPSTSLRSFANHARHFVALADGINAHPGVAYYSLVASRGCVTPCPTCALKRPVLSRKVWSPWFPCAYRRG
eukprot:3947882-Amphidinium_carterae.1